MKAVHTEQLKVVNANTWNKKNVIDYHLKNLIYDITFNV